MSIRRRRKRTRVRKVRVERVRKLRRKRYSPELKAQLMRGIPKVRMGNKGLRIFILLMWGKIRRKRENWSKRRRRLSRRGWTTKG